MGLHAQRKPQTYVSTLAHTGLIDRPWPCFKHADLGPGRDVGQEQPVGDNLLFARFLLHIERRHAGREHRPW